MILFFFHSLTKIVGKSSEKNWKLKIRSIQFNLYLSLFNLSKKQEDGQEGVWKKEYYQISIRGHRGLIFSIFLPRTRMKWEEKLRSYFPKPELHPSPEYWPLPGKMLLIHLYHIFYHIFTFIYISLATNYYGTIFITVFTNNNTVENRLQESYTTPLKIVYGNHTRHRWKPCTGIIYDTVENCV